MRPIAQIMNVQDYLARERSPEKILRSEFFNGIIIDLPGSSLPHNTITHNHSFYLEINATGAEINICTNNLRVYVPVYNSVFYPDVIVCAETPRLLDDVQDTLLNPTIIFEIASPSTEKFDRNEKLQAYTSLPSLTDYVLVAQKQIKVERFRRINDSQNWETVVYTSLDDNINVGLSSITLREIYRKVFV